VVIGPAARVSHNLAPNTYNFANQVQESTLPDILLIEMFNTSSNETNLGNGLGQRIGGNFVQFPSHYSTLRMWSVHFGENMNK
jgi:hypothetical protein